MVAQTGPLQVRRLTSAQLASITPAPGEPVWNTTLKQLCMGDGVTVGGNNLVRYNGNLNALAGLTGAADRGFYFTGSSAMSLYTLSALGRTLAGIADAAAGRAAISAAISGANSDITSLSGLTTPLSVSQGGTGVTSVAAQVSPLQTAGLYGKTNLLGTVSQASGVPTGAVIESGSNANGFFVKYADGTMICRGTPLPGIDQTVASTTAYSANYTLPATFVGVYNINVNLAAVNVQNNFSGYCRGLAISGSVIQIVQCWSVVQTYSYSYVAIGRWY